MDREQIKSKIREFLARYQLAVLSTIDVVSSKPESALVAFTETEEFEIVFGTSNSTRKYANLQKCHNVSLVIGWDPAMGTLQYEGEAIELSKESGDKYIALHIKKNPGSEKYLGDENERYFLVKPKWIRLTDNVENQVNEVIF